MNVSLSSKNRRLNIFKRSHAELNTDHVENASEELQPFLTPDVYLIKLIHIHSRVSWSNTRWRCSTSASLVVHEQKEETDGPLILMYFSFIHLHVKIIYNQNIQFTHQINILCITHTHTLISERDHQNTHKTNSNTTTESNKLT